MKRILEYISEKYMPEGVILYGSYVDGTNDADSDFDALVIGCEKFHDTSVIDGVRLDVFVYPREYLDGLTDFDEIVTVYDGKAMYDPNGFAAELIRRVRGYVDGIPKADESEKEELRAWCKKMLKRSKRGDAEGLYRGHWLLTDSLDIYCRLRGEYYFGPKKTILRIKASDKRGYKLFERALSDSSALEEWIEYVCGE